MNGDRKTVNGTPWNRTLLETVPDRFLLQLVQEANVASSASRRDMVSNLSQLDNNRIVRFIKDTYRDLVEQRRRSVISDHDLEQELQSVSSLNWRGVQGSRAARWGIRDSEIQDRYVRKFPRLSKMQQAINGDLRKNPHLAEIRDQSTASWFNHWSSVLIENQIGMHRNVVPTLSHIKGLDLFFRGFPFDLKVSTFPKRLNYSQYARNPRGLASWLYENQSNTRFGEHNRIFLVLADRTNLSLSWRLKSNVTFIKSSLDEFFDSAEVSDSNRITFRFSGRTYRPLAKVVLVSKEN